MVSTEKLKAFIEESASHRESRFDSRFCAASRDQVRLDYLGTQSGAHPRPLR